MFMLTTDSASPGSTSRRVWMHDYNHPEFDNGSEEDGLIQGWIEDVPEEDVAAYLADEEHGWDIIPFATEEQALELAEGLGREGATVSPYPEALDR